MIGSELAAAAAKSGSRPTPPADVDALARVNPCVRMADPGRRKPIAT